MIYKLAMHTYVYVLIHSDTIITSNLDNITQQITYIIYTIH